MAAWNDSDCNNVHGIAPNSPQFRAVAKTDAYWQSHFSSAPRNKQTLKLMYLVSRYKTEMMT